MSADVDMVVAGGGPAGLQFAREVRQRAEHSVVVLEANDALSDNEASSRPVLDDVPVRPEQPRWRQCMS